MANDWQVGDLAVCVDDGPCAPIVPGRRVLPPVLIAKGATYRVIGLRPSRISAGPALSLEGVDGSDTQSGAYGAWRFCKIRPDEREACEPEFVTLLKRNRVSA